MTLLLSALGVNAASLDDLTYTTADGQAIDFNKIRILILALVALTA